MEFRAHRFGDCMTEGKSSVTEKQLELIGILSGKSSLTAKQQSELERLIQKRDNPELSDTAKRYLQEFAIELKYDRRKEIISKYLDKGRKVEEAAIIILNEIQGKLYSKNTERKGNGVWTGEADVVEDYYIIDTKSSWDLHTHFANEKLNPKYEWQVRVYMELYNKDTAYVAHVLVDTPEDIIQDELRRSSWRLGYQELPQDIEDEIRHSLTFQDIPKEKKVIMFEVFRDSEKTAKMYERAKESTEYLIKYLEKI